MNTTYIIAEAARKIALSPEPYGDFDVWEDGYKVLFTYDCAFDHIDIQKGGAGCLSVEQPCGGYNTRRV